MNFIQGKKTLTLFFLTILFDFVSSVWFPNILCLFQNIFTALLSISVEYCLIVQMHQILHKCTLLFQSCRLSFYFSRTNSTRTTDQLMFKALAQIYKRVCNLNRSITGEINERDVEWGLITLYQSSWLHLCVQHNSKTENWLVRQKVVTTNYIFKCPPQIFVSLLCAVMLLFVIRRANVCGGWGVFAKRSCQKIETKRNDRKKERKNNIHEKKNTNGSRQNRLLVPEDRSQSRLSYALNRCIKSVYFFLFSVVGSAKLCDRRWREAVYLNHSEFDGSGPLTSQLYLFYFPSLFVHLKEEKKKQTLITVYNDGKYRRLSLGHTKKTIVYCIQCWSN